jgi:hypothetical protein
MVQALGKGQSCWSFLAAKMECPQAPGSIIRNKVIYTPPFSQIDSGAKRKLFKKNVVLSKFALPASGLDVLAAKNQNLRSHIEPSSKESNDGLP